MPTILLGLALTFLLQAAPARPAPAQPAGQAADKTALNEELWDAARSGDAARVTRALDRGADINAGNRYKATALFFAADKGHAHIIKLLLDRGADITVQDTFYKMRPVHMAIQNDHFEAATVLIQRGSPGPAACSGRPPAPATRCSSMPHSPPRT